MTSSATPDWAEIIDGAIQSALLDVHTAMPGQIVAIYTDEIGRWQSADVRPCLRRVLPASDDADTRVPYVEEELPVIPRVPIAFPQGGGYAITWPLAPGDFVLLVFAERSIDLWLATATKARSSTSTLSDLGAHTLDGAVALPMGPAPYANLLDVAPDAMVLGNQAGQRIYIKQDRIALGAIAPSDSVALAKKTLDELNKNKDDLTTLITAITTALGTIGTAIGDSTLVTTFTTDTAGIPQDHESVASATVHTD